MFDFRTRKLQEGCETRTDELAHAGAGRAAMELVSAGASAVIGDVHRLADMNCMVQPGNYARRMRRSHRRDDGDREHGKHGHEATEHKVDMHFSR
ncbi:hypothetical protein GTW51_20825 [Aurantimonas aggregata]|uniref:Uncharacterized protein n=1 Tax=Aurantimonas aggregata TaxID=2047720 RepID=A0A6L9MNN5_9HYPH|nr:hypothetical protein [Aurantimonas aggregata]